MPPVLKGDFFSPPLLSCCVLRGMQASWPKAPTPVRYTEGYTAQQVRMNASLEGPIMDNMLLG
jgi:hypothetical protein